MFNSLRKNASIPSQNLLRKGKQHSVAGSSARKGQQPLGAGWAGGVTPWRIGIDNERPPQPNWIENGTLPAPPNQRRFPLNKSPSPLSD